MTPIPHALTAALLLTLCALPAHAEHADRLKPLNVEADETGKLDLQKQVVTFSGSVVVSKGTMVIRAARVEVKQLPDGTDMATAYGAPGKPATFRQKRDGVDETIAGEADRLEYDGRAEQIKFMGNAAVRRLRGATVADEITGNLVTYDGTSEVFSVSGGANVSPANPGGRVRAVLTPRAEAPAAPAEAASSAPPVLKTSPTLGASSKPGDKR